MVASRHVPHIIERRNPDPESGIPKKENKNKECKTSTNSELSPLKFLSILQPAAMASGNEFNHIICYMLNFYTATFA
jgi:hypothetical protein